MLSGMAPVPTWEKESAREEEEYERDFERESRYEDFFGSPESDEFGPSRFERRAGCLFLLLRWFMLLVA